MRSRDTLTRAEIADALNRKLGLSRAESLGLVEAILDGRQPPTMQLQPLMRHGFPIEWKKQREFFSGTAR